MKNRFIKASIGLLLASLSAGAQVNVHPLVFDDNLPQEAATNLNHKLDRILSAFGYGSVSSIERVVMTATLDVVENNVTPTNPPRVSKKTELTLKIGDIIDNNVFGSATVILSGIGTNDNKAFISALNTLKPENKAIKRLFAEVDTAVSDYYAKNLTVILNKARTIALTGNYDEAIAYLVSVPPVDAECYSACQDQAVSYYIEKVNKISGGAYRNALAAWTGSKDAEGAHKALPFLKQVDPASDIYPDALALWDEISEKLDRDEIEAKEHAKQVYEDKVQFRKSILDAVKAIGVAFGEHRPQSVTKMVRYW